MKNDSGFTLVEIVVVIAILGILAGVVIVVLNPTRYFAASRDSRRQGEIRQLRDAINRLEAKGTSFESLEDLYGEVGDCDGNPTNIGTGFFNLEEALVPLIMSEMPIDPSAECNNTDTCYDICKLENGNIKITAPLAESTDIEIK